MSTIKITIALCAIIAATSCSVAQNAKSNPPAAAVVASVSDSDIATMERLYCANGPENDPDTRFTQCVNLFGGKGEETIWANTGDENLTGAIFQRRDGRLTLIAETGRNRCPSVAIRDGREYLSVEGSAGGPAWYREIYVFSSGRLVETFTCLEVYAAIDAATLNGRQLTPAEAQSYLASLPAFHPLSTTP